MALTRVTNKYINSMSGSKLEGTFPESPKVDGALLTGISGVDTIARTNLALNYFKDSVNNTTDRMALEQGWVDTFEDESDIDGYVTPSTGNVSDYESKVNLTLFDGTNDYLSTSPSNLGISNGKKFTMSFWYEPSVDSVDELFFAQNNNTFFIGRTTSGQLRVRYKSNTTTVIGDVFSPANKITVAGGKTHILIVIDTTQTNATDRVKISFNGGAIETLTDSTSPVLDGVIDITTDPTILIGSKIAGNDKIRGNLGQFYLAEDAVDISVQANRELFYKDGPVFLGANGENPTGNQPRIYLNNMYDSFQNNSGSGGNFSVTGELVYGGEIATGKGEFKYSVPDDNFTNSYEIIDSYGKENRGSFYEMSSNLATVVGQSINLASDTSISKFAVQLSKAGSPTGIATFWIGDATGTAGSTGDAAYTNDQLIGSIDVSTLTTSYVTHYFTPPEPIRRASGDMVVYVSYSGGGGADKLHVGMDASGAASGSNLFIQSGPQVTYDLTYYLYGQKNLDLITKGSDDIGNSPSVAPEKGHMEVLLNERPASGTTTWSDTLDSSTGYQTFTVRTVLSASDISSSGSRIRIRVEAGSGEACDIDNIAIVERSGQTAHGVTIPTEVLFGGTSGVIIPDGGMVYSDWLDFEINSSKDYLVIFDVGSNGTADLLAQTTSGGGGRYLLGGANSYNTASMSSGYSENSGYSVGINLLEVENQQTLGTDIIAEMSRGVDGNGDKVWSPVTLTRTKTQVADMSYNILAGEADFTDGDPSGTNIVGRIRTGNKDKITVKGISVNWK